MSFVPIEGALGAVKTGFELIKGVRELLKKDKVNPAEVSSQLLDLQELLLETRTSLVEANIHIAKLETDLAAKVRLDELEKLLVYDQTVYWKTTGNAGEVEPDPYCTGCWERGRKLSHLRPGATKGTHTRQIDGTSYQTDAYHSSPITPRTRTSGFHL
jgi:hypothetical protein